MARLLANPRSRVRFAGFTSDTYTLGQHGWNISVEENIEFARYQMMLHHEGANVIMHAEGREHPMREHQARMTGWYGHGFSRDEFEGPDFNVIQVFVRNPNLKVYHSMPVFHEWSETRPTAMNFDPASYNPFDFPIFMKKNVVLPVKEELIVEPQDVMQLLEQIKRLQEPEQAAIRQRQRRREETPVVHAQIISLERAA